MSRNGDSTRDWLLKKLLKAKESLMDQSREIAKLGARLSDANSLAQDIEQKLLNERDGRLEAVNAAMRLAERVDDLEFEVQQLKRVPPIAPNLTVIYRDRRGLSEQLKVTSVEHANGQSIIRTIRQ